MSELRLAIRSLRATPVVSAVAAVSLALGIGANTAIFSLVNGLLLRTLPVADPQRLVTISTDSAVRIGFNAGIGWNYPMWDAMRSRAQAFDGALTWKTEMLDLAQGGEKQPVRALITSGDFFTTLGVRAAAGRMFTAADDARGGGPDGAVAVISHEFWQRRFGSAAGAMGSSLTIERVPFRIVGVTPRGFSGLEVGRSFDVALPLGTEPLFRGNRALIDQPRTLTLFVMLRLKPEQSIAGATAALRAMQDDVHGPLQLPRFAREPFVLVPAGAGVDMPGSARPKYERPLLALFAIVGLVLLIACANIANVLLARAAGRRHEMSVRLAFGASRWRLGRQLLVESLVLSGVGAAGGLVLALVATPPIVTQLSVNLDTSLEWRALTFTAAVTVLTALLFGAGAAFRAMRLAPIDALKQQSRGVTPGRGRGASTGLVVAQVALSLVLVTGAALFTRSFTRLTGVPLGFDKDRLVLARVDLSRAPIDQDARATFYQRLVDAVSAVPGVARAAGSLSTPFDMGLPGEVTVPGAPAGAESERIVLANRVTPGWFATFGTPLRSGREFDTRDTATALPVVIVNDAFVEKFFPTRNPLGQVVSDRTVVGVVANQIAHGGFHADGRQRSLKDTAPPTIYEPLAQFGGARPTATISIRVAGDAPTVMRGIAGALAATHPDLTFTMRPLTEELDAAVAQERVIASLSGFFGVLAVLLAGLGLYGVTSHAASRQRAEIGIRLALGATPGGIVRLILSRVAVLVIAGIVCGAAVSVWASELVASLLYGLTPRDPMAFVAAAMTLAAVGAFAGAVPAIRAARIDPIKTLREN